MIHFVWFWEKRFIPMVIVQVHIRNELEQAVRRIPVKLMEMRIMFFVHSQTQRSSCSIWFLLLLLYGKIILDLDWPKIEQARVHNNKSLSFFRWKIFLFHPILVESLLWFVIWWWPTFKVPWTHISHWNLFVLKLKLNLRIL